LSKIHKSYNISVAYEKPVIIQGNLSRHLDLAVDNKANTLAAEKSAEAILAEANQKAQEIIKHASRDASRIVDAARREADQIRSEAEAQGYREGFGKGRLEGQKEYEQACLEAMEAAVSLTKRQNQYIDGMEEEFVTLVLDTAAKILKKEIDRNDEAFTGIIRQALDSIRVPEGIVIRIHPCKYDQVNEMMQSISTRGTESDIRIVQDDGMDQTDCIIETCCGIMDVGVKTQLDQIGKAFRRLLD